MPHTQSAAKRLRQNEVRRIRNKDRTTEIKTIRKQILRAVHDGQKDQAEQLYRSLSQRLDQAAGLRTIHPNAAARTKARIAKVIAGGPAAAAAALAGAGAGKSGAAGTATATPAGKTEPAAKTAAPTKASAPAPKASKPKKPTA